MRHGMRRRFDRVGIATTVGLAASALTLVGTSVTSAPALAQSGTARTPYQQLRYNDDFAYLADPARRDDVWDPLKYIKLGDDPSFYLTLGGELRERYGHYDEPFFGLRRRDQEDYLFHRLLLSADLHL